MMDEQLLQSLDGSGSTPETSRDSQESTQENQETPPQNPVHTPETSLDVQESTRENQETPPQNPVNTPEPSIDSQESTQENQETPSKNQSEDVIMMEAEVNETAEETSVRGDEQPVAEKIPPERDVTEKIPPEISSDPLDALLKEVKAEEEEVPLQIVTDPNAHPETPDETDVSMKDEEGPSQAGSVTDPDVSVMNAEEDVSMKEEEVTIQLTADPGDSLLITVKAEDGEDVNMKDEQNPLQVSTGTNAGKEVVTLNLNGAVAPLQISTGGTILSNGNIIIGGVAVGAIPIQISTGVLCNSVAAPAPLSTEARKKDTGPTKRPYSCSTCRKAFCQLSTFSEHLKTHTVASCDAYRAKKRGRAAAGDSQIVMGLVTATPDVDNSVPNLRNFSNMDLETKKQIIKKGRPMPVLDLLIRGSKNVTRSFQMDWYQRKDWLCGCGTKNRLYCFPCLLFSHSRNSWTTEGFYDLKNLSRALCKHERSTSHIECQIELKTFGTSKIALAVNEHQRLHINIHNAKVKENREILKYLIDAVCYLAKQDIPFGGHRASSSDRGNFVELCHSFAGKDETLAKHLETSSVFSGLSDKMQNNLIEAVADVVKYDITEEMNASPFVAVEVDEITDVTNRSQISVIARYVAKSDAQEAFLGFGDLSDRKAASIADHVLNVLKTFNCVDKLVAQSYDGNVVVASELKGVQEKIKEKVPEAKLIHNYAHNLNLVLMNSAKCIPDCKNFFKVAEGLATFFNTSAKRAQLLEGVIKKRSPTAATTKWSSISKLVPTISACQADLHTTFRLMSESSDSWDNDTLILSVGFDLWLSETSTCFLLTLYERIFKETELLSRVLKNKVMDIDLCCRRIQETMAFVECQRKEYDNFYNQFQNRCAIHRLTEDQRTKHLIKDKRRKLFNFVLDDVYVQLKCRFHHFDELAFLGLVDCTKLISLSVSFEDSKLQSLSKYLKYFDLVRLKSDLIGLYGSKILRTSCKTPKQMLSFLVDNDLISAAPEAARLLQLVFTIPAAHVHHERPHSALKRLKTYSRNRTSEEGPASLPIITIERERLLRLRENKEDFYNKVTDCFVRRDGRIDFVYK